MDRQNGSTRETISMMDGHARFALAHPVFDPERQIIAGHYWKADHMVSAFLTVNIGME